MGVDNVSSAGLADGDRPLPTAAAVEAEYQRRHADRENRRAAEQKSADRLGNLRLLLAVAALALIIMPLFSRDGTPWWGLIPVAVAFVFLGRAQDRVFDRRRRAAAAALYYRQGLDRFEETWRTLPDDGADLKEALRTPQDYADDLDLFGPASLFQLVSRATTAEGRRAVARWLMQPASVEEAVARQAAVREFAAAPDAREALVTASAGEARGAVRDDALLKWAEAGQPIPMAGLLQTVGFVLPALLIASIAAYALVDHKLFLLVMVVIQGVVFIATRGIIAPRAEVLSGPERVLSRYARLIETIEKAAYGSPRLKRVQADLRTEGRSAADQIRGLERLVELLDARLNFFFAVSLSPVLLWELNLVLRTERWRTVVGPRLRGWLRAIGEVEALASLGALAHERPDYGFAVFVDGPPRFDATALSHPLIDRRRVVANDLTLGGPGSVLLLSGSNMSGKSTLLRAVGLAWVMARAGGPAAATALTVSHLRLATSVRIVDSLADGTSHFYAEVKRLKHIVDQARDPAEPLLYLLDEVLHGTNSKERFIGAVTVVKWLANSGAMGIVTTHDLALAALVDDLPPGKAINRHFSDSVVGNEIRFDYALRDGPVRSTNAIRLMRSVGIDLDFDTVDASGATAAVAASSAPEAGEGR